MSWAQWDRGNPAGLLGYLHPEQVGALLPGLPSRAEGHGGDRYAKLAAVYAQFAAAGIRYADEPIASTGATQAIRPPDQVIAPPGWVHAPRSGTCVDLSIAFAAACLYAGLHPVIVVCDPVTGGPAHAFVVVWLHGEWPGEVPDLAGDSCVHPTPWLGPSRLCATAPGVGGPSSAAARCGELGRGGHHPRRRRVSWIARHLR